MSLISFREIAGLVLTFLICVAVFGAFCWLIRWLHRSGVMNALSTVAGTVGAVVGVCYVGFHGGRMLYRLLIAPWFWPMLDAMQRAW
jgi:hypothetical protein